MADLVLTASSVAVDATPTPTKEPVTFGSTVTQGAVLYKDTADDKWKLADATTQPKSGQSGIGISLNAGSNGQPGDVLTAGVITLTTTPALTVGSHFYVSLTAGAGNLAPLADLVTGDWLTLFAVAIAANKLWVRPWHQGIALP